MTVTQYRYPYTLEDEWGVKEPEGFDDAGRLIFKMTLGAMKWEDALTPPEDGTELTRREFYRGQIEMGLDLLVRFYPLTDDGDPRLPWILMLFCALPRMSIE